MAKHGHTTKTTSPSACFAYGYFSGHLLELNELVSGLRIIVQQCLPPLDQDHGDLSEGLAGVSRAVQQKVSDLHQDAKAMLADPRFNPGAGEAA